VTLRALIRHLRR